MSGHDVVQRRLKGGTPADQQIRYPPVLRAGHFVLPMLEKLVTNLVVREARSGLSPLAVIAIAGGWRPGEIQERALERRLS
jgi:hypothetical protein